MIIIEHRDLRAAIYQGIYRPEYGTECRMYILLVSETVMVADPDHNPLD